MKKKTVVLIPSLNPDKELIKYVKKLINSDNNIEVIVVNDGSRKELKSIFDEIEKIKRCVVLTHAVNLGKGRALKNGFNYFINNYSNEEANGIITADSDGQHAIDDILKIAEDLNSAKCETLVLGTRDFNLDHVPFKSRKGNKITTAVFKLLYGKKINDTQTGLRGLTYDFVKDCISLDGERFEYEINMLIEAVKRKINILEPTIETIYFDNNSETHFRPVMDSLKIYNVMFKKFFKFAFSGLSSAVLDIALFTLFYGLLDTICGENVSILVSTIGARIISSLFNYTINKNVVFNATKGKGTLIKYYTLCLIQTGASWGLVNGGYILLGKFIHPSVIKVVVDALLFLVSFQIQQRWVFGVKEKKND
ncbi:MAG: glycosyltransferase [Bacilli bacterium]|nr:glycosyltransferase [Bacilli bacterium]